MVGKTRLNLYSNQNNNNNNVKPNSNSFLDFFDANPNKDGFQLFNNPRNNAVSSQTVIQTPTGTVNPNEQGLLSNEEVVDQNTQGLLNRPTFPAREGGYTYGMNQQNQTNTTTNNNRPTGPASEGSYTHGYGLGKLNAETNKDGTPKKKSFLDSLKQFANSDFGLDMAMKGLEASAPKVGTPTSTGRTLFEAYNYAKQQKQQKIDNEINRQKAKTDNAREPVFRGLLRAEDGSKYQLYSSGGKGYVNTENGRVYEKDFERMFGKTDYGTIGQENFGILPASNFYSLQEELVSDSNTLQKLTDYLRLQGGTNIGYKRIGDGIFSHVKTVLGVNELTTEELQLALANGTLQELIGGSRVEIVGGGVMTEQDALRIIQALGGNVDALQKPEVVKQKISEIFGRKYKNYESKRNRYNNQIDNHYFSLGEEKLDKLNLSENQIKSLDLKIATEAGLTNYSDKDMFPNELLLEMLTTEEYKNISDSKLKEQFLNEIKARQNEGEF